MRQQLHSKALPLDGISALTALPRQAVCPICWMSHAVVDPELSSGCCIARDNLHASITHVTDTITQTSQML
jgi:hypothetical protein